MKKIVLVMTLAAATATSAQAQLFLGGSLGFDYTATSTTRSETAGTVTVKGPAYTYVDVSPMAGFYLSDNFAIGVRGSFGTGTTDNRKDEPQANEKGKLSKWGAEAFARLSVVSAHELSFFLEGGGTFAGTSTETTRGNTTEKGPGVSELGVYVLPVLSYELTDVLHLEMRPNLLRLGFSMATLTYPDRQDRKGDKESITSYGIGVNSSATRSSVTKAALLSSGSEFDMLGNLFAALPLLEIGIVFKF